MDIEKAACHQCIGEKYVKNIVKKHGKVTGPCNYCKKRLKNIPLSKVTEIVHQVFESYFQPEDDDGYSSMDGSRSAKVLIGEELIVDEKIADDIYELLCEDYNWHTDYDPARYNDGYIYSRREFSINKLDHAWKKVKASLSEEARFFNDSVKDFLDDLFSDLDDFRIENSKSPIKTIDGDVFLYRARVFESWDQVNDALRHPERNFGPPPAEQARAGRMNAQGIAVFYGATTPNVAISEVRPPVGSHVVVAPFAPQRALRILDISELDSLVFSKESIFNPSTIKSHEKTGFLKKFSRKMTIPVFGKQQDNEYLITQAIAEYLSVSKKYQLDGISFRSTQIKKANKTRQRKKEDGYNVVLFSKSSRVLDSGLDERTYKVNLLKQVAWSDSKFNPTIHLIKDDKIQKNQHHFPSSNKLISLELISSGLTYYHIQGVSYQTFEKEIELSLPVDKNSENQDMIDF
ncbi:RES domain-containing protein [Rahnella sp. ChDrAdgB13]|uniref:RES domain-containing protein n=1 Tax=Rahnella sp. ChDrAdgB13 TaxID=1850581 RepID=UPI001AD896F1|nr:RES domain-containing protein [Rahnella sp. ChDrAdgB13]